jgi:broad specificity phosphatase PhoE
MSFIDWQIPPSVLAHLERVPRDQAVTLLLRHSVRDQLPPGEAGNVLPITSVGRQLARELGERLRGRLRTLHASPLLRCIQTAEALREGADTDYPIIPDHLLGDPGAFVLDGRLAWSNWEQLGHESVMRHLVSEAEALPGMARPDEAARFLVQHMLAVASDEPGVHAFVTHDSVVTATAARMLGRALGRDDWPWYLEGALFWRDPRGVAIAYRDYHGHRQGPLCTLAEPDIVEFARREIAATVGLDSDARFFLAGGAFKSLLTGRAPRDLDLWAPSKADRGLLLQTLRDRGAQSLDSRPFAEAFGLANRVIEVPHKIEPPTLEQRLARFDIALSAVGVEHRPGDQWFVRVHPRAEESIRRREVLLLAPLVNWRYALTTLERMRRYAHELGFVVPADQEAEIWRVFEEQPAEMRAEMVERYRRTASGGFGVAEEIAGRLDDRTE